MAFALSATPTAGTGTISIAANGTTVTGVGTDFVTQALNGKIILINNHNALVTGVASATSMTINRAPTFAISGATFSFVNNGTRIDQTGTDANPSGLGAISGVFSHAEGTAPSIQSFDLGSLLLYIQGTMTIPDMYWVKATGGSAGNAITVGTTGKLVIDGRYTMTKQGGATKLLYSLVCGIIIRKPSGVPYSVNTIQFDSGSQFEQYGGILESSGSIRWLTTTTSIATMRQATWYIMDRNSNGYMNIYFNLKKLSIDGLKIYSNGTAYPGILQTLDPGYTVKGYEVIGGLAGISAIDGTTAQVRLDNFVAGGGTFDFLVRNGGTVTSDTATVGGYDFYNASVGNDLVAGTSGASASQITGRVRHYLTFTPTFLDATSSAGIVGGVLYQKDANSGARVTNNGVPGDKVYINTSGAGGAFPSIDLLTKVWSGLGVINMNQDNRLPISGYFWNYNHIGTPVNITSSLGPQDPTLYAPADAGVTLSSAVAATKLASSFTVDRAANNVTWNTNASTLDDWYDAMKSYKCVTTQAQLEYPTLASKIVDFSGTSVSSSIQQTINVAQTQGAKFKDLSGNKPWIIGSGGSSTFNRGTIVWTPASYGDQIRVQSGGTLNLTNGTLMTINPTVGLGYGTAATAMFRSGSTLNMSDSTVIYNIVSGGAGTFFSNSEANATWNISNSTLTLNCPNNAQVAVHAYFKPESVINGLTVNGTASNVVWQMGYTTNNSKMVGFKYGGAIFGNGTSNILMDTYTYTGVSATIPSNFGSSNKWWWVDPTMQAGGLFRWNAGSTPTGNSGFFGVIGFRPTIKTEKTGYAPKMRITPSSMASRYPSKIIQTSAESTVSVSEFFRDPTFMSASDGFLPFVDSLDDKTVLNTIDWTLNFRQPGWIDQTKVLTASTAKTGLVSYNASGAVDSNYVNATTAAADSALITVNNSTKTIAPVSGTLSWSPQRMYNALKNWWATFASDTDFLAATGGGYLDLGDYSTASTIKFVAGTNTDALTSVRTTGTINSTDNDIPVTDSRGTSTILRFIGVPNKAAACVWDATTGASDLYVLNTTGSTQTYTIKYPPGSAGLVKKTARELYPYKREGETITLAPGEMWVTYPDSEDVGITNTSQTSVAAYTSLETNSKLYDYLAVKRLEEAFIKLGQIITRSGQQLVWDDGLSGKLKKDNASVMSKTGSVLYFKATSLAGDAKYTTHILTPPATLTADTDEVISTEIEDANGNSSITVNSDLRSGAQIWKIPASTASVDYATGTLVATVTKASPKWRFIGDTVSGYEYLAVDNYSTTKARCSALKGTYTLNALSGDAVISLNQPQIDEIYTRVQSMQLELTAIKGTTFDQNKHGLDKATDYAKIASQNGQT